MSRGLHNIKGKDAVKAFIKFGGVERKAKEIISICRME